VTLTMLHFREFISGVMSGLYLGSCMPNFKFASLAILELLAFNCSKFNIVASSSSSSYIEVQRTVSSE